MSDNRIPTAIPGFDEVLHGGLIREHCYLIVGAAGTGKTVFSLQWLLQGITNGKKGLYITLAEPVGKIEQNVTSFGWKLDSIDMLDLTIKGERAGPGLGEYHIFPPSDVEHNPVWQGIYDAVREKRPKLVVIDSVTQLRYLSADEYQFRKQILALVSFLNESGCTSFLAFEPSELERETSVALAVDGIVRLRMQVSPSRVIGLRSVQIDKLRGSDFMTGLHPMRITSDGIHIYPHRIEEAGELLAGQYTVSSGNGELDELLGGGLESGTTTIITGPAGVGKSMLATHFIVKALSEKEGTHGVRRAVLYTFEESVNAIIKRCAGVGLPLEKLIEDGSLKIVRVNAMNLYPDEFLQMVREVVEQGACDLMVLDSLRGYELAMEEFGTPQAHLHNLVTYLGRKGVTTLLLNEVERITGDLMATEHKISHLADNIILMRYAEHASRVIKIIGCLKKRLGGFEPELRELQITGAGISVSKKLTNLRGILTGVPGYVSDL
ncbi:MAG TPA: ATPase domain-containing protein [Blastocatellia bacterium]|jgi:circadian clock protein KaiC|nr:ATPase domain-containing protein [Blastocatellia bacterium]